MIATSANRGVVVHVSADSHRVAFNRGEEHGILLGQRYLVYSVEHEELKDPETGAPLGRLEVVRGTGVVVHVQAKLATIQSDRTDGPVRQIIRRANPRVFGFLQPIEGLFEESEVTNLPPKSLPFDAAEVGDFVKRVS